MPTLNHSPQKILAYMLVDLGIVTGPGIGGSWPILIGQEINSPDQLVIAYGSAPISQGDNQPDGEAETRYGVQFMVRDLDEDTGYIKANAIFTALEPILRQTVSIGSNAYHVQSVSPRAPIPLNRQTNSGHLYWSINATTTLWALSGT